MALVFTHSRNYGRGLVKKITVIILVLGMVSGNGRADDRPLPDDQKTRDGYSMGYEYGDSLRRQSLDLDVEALIRALRDALAGNKPEMSLVEMKSTLLDLRRRSMIAQDRRIRELTNANQKKEREFLAANGKKSGVNILADGIQYKVLREGMGASPKKSDIVKVHYRGTLIDGTEFDRSGRGGEPALMPVSGGIRGLDEVLPLMKAGAKWQIVIPSRLAYGNLTYNRIPPGSTLIFDLELISIEKAEIPTVGSE